MTRSETIRRRIIWHLRFVWRFSEGGNSWKSFEALAKELRLPIVSIKRETRRLAKAGVLSHRVAVDADGIPKGSGYFLAPLWEQHRSGRNDDPTPDEFSWPEHRERRRPATGVVHWVGKLVR